MDTIYNFVRNTETLGTGGQPTAAQIPLIPQAGYRSVINLASCTSGETLPLEGHLVASLGLTYVHIPVPWEAPRKEHVRQFFGAMRTLSPEPVFVHCIANYRASAFAYLWLRHELGLPEAEARSPILRQWAPDPNWAAVLSWTPSDLGE